MGRTLQPTWEFIFIEVSFRIAPPLQAPFHTHSLKGSRNSSRYSSSRRFSKSLYHSSRRLSQSSISILSLLIQTFFVLILVSPSLRDLLGPNKIPSYSSWYLRRCGISSGLTKIPSYSSWYLHRCGISSGLPKISSYSSWYLRRCGISSGLTKIPSYSYFASQNTFMSQFSRKILIYPASCPSMTMYQSS